MVPMAVAYWETVGCNVAVYSLGTGHQAMDQHEVEVLLRRFPTREMRKMMIAMQMEEPEEIDTISEGKQPTVMNNIFWVATHCAAYRLHAEAPRHCAAYRLLAEV